MTGPPFEELTAAEFDRVLAVNARGTLLAMQHAARRMSAGGRIVNISSMSTVWASPGESAYAASKAAVEQLTSAAAKELGARYHRQRALPGTDRHRSAARGAARRGAGGHGLA